MGERKSLNIAKEQVPVLQAYADHFYQCIKLKQIHLNVCRIGVSEVNLLGLWTYFAIPDRYFMMKQFCLKQQQVNSSFVQSSGLEANRHYAIITEDVRLGTKVNNSIRGWTERIPIDLSSRYSLSGKSCFETYINKSPIGSNGKEILNTVNTSKQRRCPFF